LKLTRDNLVYSNIRGYRLNIEILNASIAKPSEFAHHQRSTAQFKTIQLSTSDLRVNGKKRV